MAYKITSMTKELVRRKNISKAMKRANIVRSDSFKKKVKEGNTGQKRTIETRKNISKSLLGNKRRIGTKHTSESKLKMRLAKLGKPGPMKGHKASAETRRKQSIAQIHSKKRKYKDTKIELAIEKELIQREIKYDRNIGIEKIANVDFYLSEYNTIIQCDGCFWHGCPIHNPTWHERRERDSTQDKQLLSKGYTVYRFWEHDIKVSPSECISSINFN